VKEFLNMEIKPLSRFDAADYLKSPEDIAAYLDAAVEENGDNPAAIALALGAVARAQSMSNIARVTGLSREGLYKAFSGKGNPSLATISKIASSLGLELSFRPKSKRSKALKSA
jgi:probable addiction module antidote protein